MKSTTPVAEGEHETVAFALGIRTVSKTYPGTTALSRVTFDVRRGSIHALLGGNGSGKSTLVKILAGVTSADPGGAVALPTGEIDAELLTPAVARDAGLRFVHQDLGIFPDMSVADNLSLGRAYETTVLGGLDNRAIRARARELMDRFDIDADVNDALSSLSASTRALVAIARALQDESASSHILVLDEPTASLPAHEVANLFRTLRRLADAGNTVILISHRLDEVLEHADHVTVLRDGLHIWTGPTVGLSEKHLGELIMGRKVTEVARRPSPPADAASVLEVSHLSTGPVQDASFTLAAGEVVGIAGLLGSGRSSLLLTIFGAKHRRAGQIIIDGQIVPQRASVASTMRRRVAFVPEDRGSAGIFGELSVSFNMLATRFEQFWRVAMLTDREREAAAHLADRFGVKAATVEDPVSTLSGGNQQKAIIARWLSRHPQLILLDEPSHGVDVGARAEIYALIREATDAGAAALVVASDFAEVARYCDRVLILRDGSLVDELTTTDPHTITEAVYATSRRKTQP